ncbi:hypothetical protein BOTBODRAFT_442527 [Botryobasidium botryosum FD-172 SS1]|uniref:Uncharacterized protein n=1 Tax=Botryobasidium botryosum (strain FD-172 SS1) TaxID=930990 RepID=A0A067MUW5_BOTB1|nr:hypothetical protein BOTBODRAFT_442527 [Botryobasidium botryosum FD-172 SS1]
MSAYTGRNTKNERELRQLCKDISTVRDSQAVSRPQVCAHVNLHAARRKLILLNRKRGDKK